jgi:hypothetical protein
MVHCTIAGNSAFLGSERPASLCCLFRFTESTDLFKCSCAPRNILSAVYEFDVGDARCAAAFNLLPDREIVALLRLGVAGSVFDPAP